MVSPLELLENRPDRQPSFLNQFFNPLACGLTGFGLALYLNFAFKKPIWSGIQKHILLTTVGLGIGFYSNKKWAEHVADRDAVLRHYIQLHPEDFPTPERKKYGEILERWVPIR